MTVVDGFRVKKRYGQHFLRNADVAHSAVQNALELAGQDANVIEIGCGDGFLTNQILKRPVKRLWVYEIDPDWASHVRDKFSDERLHVIHENVLDANFDALKEHGTWVLIANLPYQVTFPILYRIQKYRDLIPHGVVMIQEEVAQKIVKTGGRGYGYTSLYFQHFFAWKLLDKVLPASFLPPPKVNSRLIQFALRKDLVVIPQEAEFWRFVKVLFLQPRRTTRNNLRQTHYSLDRLDEATLQLRAQQLIKEDILDIWNRLITDSE